MMRIGLIVTIAIWPALCQTQAAAQVSSLGAQKRRSQVGKPPVAVPREAPRRERNLTYERYSWISVTPPPLKTFKPGDLLTIVVRERRQFEAESDLEIKKQFDIKSELQAFFNLTGGGIGASEFSRGKPTIDYKFINRVKNEADTTREDTLTTRVTATIIDVKPNGLLVLEARARIAHDEEISTITLTGTCRKEDVTADNTVLSTQIADKNVVVHNEGALRAAATRGWITKLLDWLKPI